MEKHLFISEYFVSEEFFEDMGPLNTYLVGEDSFLRQQIMDKVIEWTLNCNLLLGEDTENSRKQLTKFVRKISKHIVENMISVDKDGKYSLSRDINKTSAVNKYYQDVVLNKFGINKNENLSKLDPNKKSEIEDYILRKTVGEQTVFHATNSSNYDSIKTYGLDPTKRQDDQSELVKIDSLFRSHNVSNILGWQQINSKDKVFYEEATSSMYSYASGSPEWMAQFCGSSLSYDYKSYPNKNAFYVRNHEKAKENLDRIMTEKGFTEEEKDEVIFFLNKNWIKYAYAEPMIISIPIASDEKTIQREIQVNREMYHKDDAEDFTELIDSMFRIRDLRIDNRSETAVSTKGATYMKAPNLNDVVILAKRELEYQANQREQDGISP